MKYKITKNCPDKIIFQALPSGYYDYSEFGSAEAAWESEKCESWINEIEEETARQEFFSTLEEATQEEALQAAEDGYGWPIELGFVEKVGN